MPIAQELKKLRGQSYGDKPVATDKKDEAPPENQIARSFDLTDDEKQAFANAKPGDEVSCEVTGKIEGDGRFNVLSVAPSVGGDAESDESQMANMVAQRVQPTIAPSPS